MPQFPASFDLSTLDGSNGFSVIGVDNYSYAGFSAASAGDVNGDGFDDLIAGAPESDLQPGSYGSFVIFGRAGGFPGALNLSSLDGTDGFRIAGDAGAGGGGLVAAAGDINGDGFGDVFAAGENGGGMYVVFGKASGFAASIDQADLDGTDGFRIVPASAGDDAGASIDTAGDVNGDGLDDFIIGAPDGGSPAAKGVSYVVFGATAGFGADFDLATLDGANGFTIGGEAGGDNSGAPVASAGDVNGDGIGDLIVGARNADPNGSGSGASYVVFGTAGGFAANLNLASMNGANGFQINGEAAIVASGTSVSSAGDVNGDGFDDVVVGAPNADHNGAGTGSAYVVFGKASGFTANLNLAGLNGTSGFRIDGGVASGRLGNAVSGAGDVNGDGDGFADVIVGASHVDPHIEYDVGGPFTAGYAGRAYVVFGAASGLGAAIDVAALDGDNGFELTSPLVAGYLGRTVSGAGDVDGDGFDDIAVGGHRVLNLFYGEPNGQAYTVFGTKPTDAVARTGSAIGQRINGGLGADTLTGLGGGDELIGHENADSLAGGTGNDVLKGGPETTRCSAVRATTPMTAVPATMR